MLVALAILSTVTVVGVVGAITYECQANGYCLAPFTPHSVSGETVRFDRYTITNAQGQSNPGVLSMWIRNTGHF
jgi:hypothetical protein